MTNCLSPWKLQDLAWFRDTVQFMDLDEPRRMSPTQPLSPPGPCLRIKSSAARRPKKTTLCLQFLGLLLQAHTSSLSLKHAHTPVSPLCSASGRVISPALGHGRCSQKLKPHFLLPSCPSTPQYPPGAWPPLSGDRTSCSRAVCSHFSVAVDDTWQT